MMNRRRILLYGLVFGLTGPFFTLLFLIFIGSLLNGELPGKEIFDYQLILPMIFIAYFFGVIPAFITGCIASFLPRNKRGCGATVLVGVLLATSPFLIIGVPLVHSDGTISTLGWIAVASACTSALLAWLMTLSRINTI